MGFAAKESKIAEHQAKKFEWQLLLFDMSIPQSYP